MSERLKPTEKTLKRLFAASGNVCAFPGCTYKLTYSEHKDAPVCHIEGAEPGGERYNPELSPEDRRHYDNLIILCHNHHVTTDEVRKYTRERLWVIKANHEKMVLDSVMAGKNLQRNSDWNYTSGQLLDEKTTSCWTLKGASPLPFALGCAAFSKLVADPGSVATVPGFFTEKSFAYFHLHPKKVSKAVAFEEIVTEIGEHFDLFVPSLDGKHPILEKGYMLIANYGLEGRGRYYGFSAATAFRSNGEVVLFAGLNTPVDLGRIDYSLTEIIKVHSKIWNSGFHLSMGMHIEKPASLTLLNNSEWIASSSSISSFMPKVYFECRPFEFERKLFSEMLSECGVFIEPDRAPKTQLFRAFEDERRRCELAFRRQNSFDELDF